MFKWMITGHKGSKKGKQNILNNSTVGSNNNINNNNSSVNHNDKNDLQHNNNNSAPLNEDLSKSQENLVAASSNNVNRRFQQNGLNRSGSRDTLDDSNEYSSLEQIQQEKFDQRLNGADSIDHGTGAMNSLPPRIGLLDDRGNSQQYDTQRSLSDVRYQESHAFPPYGMPQQPLPPLPNRDQYTSPPQAPGTCTLPRRALTREDPSTKTRSPSNPPPSSRHPPPYSRHQPPDPKARVRRPCQPPPPPRVPNEHVSSTRTVPGDSSQESSNGMICGWQSSQQWNQRDPDSGFESLTSRAGDTQGSPPSDGGKRISAGQNHSYLRESLPSKSTENLLVASKVSGDSSSSSLSESPDLHPARRVSVYPSNSPHDFQSELSISPNHKNKVGPRNDTLPSDSVYPSAGGQTFLSYDKRNDISRQGNYPRSYPQEMTSFKSPSWPRSPSKQVEMEIPKNEQPKSAKKFHAEEIRMYSRPESPYKYLESLNSPQKDSRCEHSKNSQSSPSKFFSHTTNEINHLSKERLYIHEGDDFKESKSEELQVKKYKSTDVRGWIQTCHSYNDSTKREPQELKVSDEPTKSLGLSFSCGMDPRSKITPGDAHEKMVNSRNEEECPQEERKKGDGCTSSSSSSWMEWTQQLQAYVAWVNSQLRKKPGTPLVTDLRRDFQNGVVFADLIEIIDVGVGPDEPYLDLVKTPSLTRRQISTDTMPDDPSTSSLRRQPSLTNTHIRPSSPVYENIPSRRGNIHTRWAYDSLRASHKFHWSPPENHPPKVPPKPSHSEQESVSEGVNSSVSLNTSLNTSFDGGGDLPRRDIKTPNSEGGTPGSVDYWKDIQPTGEVTPSNTSFNTESSNDTPFRYHTIHRMSGRRKLPQIPGQSSPSSCNSRGTTPQGLPSDSPLESLEIEPDSKSTSILRHSNGTNDENSREPEGRSQNSSPATSVTRGSTGDSWRRKEDFDPWAKDEIKEGLLREVAAAREQFLGGLTALDGEISKVNGGTNTESLNLRQEVLKHIIARQTLENDKMELGRHLQQKETLINELRRQLAQKEQSLLYQRNQLDDALRTVQATKQIRNLQKDVNRGQSREEMQLVREAITALRSNFRDTDPNQHTLDTLEQAIAVLMERSGGPPNNVDSSNAVLGRRDKRNFSGYIEESTKVIYFTDRTVTPFMSTITKRLGEVTLRDFKNMFDRSGAFRFHFKSQDPEYGLVKEEIIDDEDVLPGIDGKIIAWVEEDVE